jgi:hypothetical protein
VISVGYQRKAEEGWKTLTHNPQFERRGKE